MDGMAVHQMGMDHVMGTTQWKIYLWAMAIMLAGAILFICLH